MFHPSQQALKKIMLKDLLSVYPQLQGIRGEVAWGGYMGYARHKMPQLGQLKPGATYIYEKADGITYAREFGAPHNDRFEIGRDYQRFLKDVERWLGVKIEYAINSKFPD